VDEVGGNIVLIVNGILIRDDAHVIATILQKAKAIMDSGQLLADAVSAMQTSIAAFVTDVEDLLTQPQPDIAAAVDALHAMQTAVDAEAQKVLNAVHPPTP
jgi:L-rhamnose isomerase